MKKQLTKAQELRSDLGADAQNYTDAAKQKCDVELSDFAISAEQLLQGARAMAQIIGHPAAAQCPNIKVDAAEYAAIIKASTASLTSIHAERARFNAAVFSDKTALMMESIRVSQLYVSWIEDYQRNAIPLAAKITDEFMEVKEACDGAQ